MTRTGNLSTWLLRGTYPRLYVPIALIILLVTSVRYHYLLEAEIEEADRLAAAELRRASDFLLPRLAALPPSDTPAIHSLLEEGITRLGPGVEAIRWESGNHPATEVHTPAPRAQAPGWFSRWLDIPLPLQQSGQALTGKVAGRLTTTLHAQPLVDRIWGTVVVQARISALNIFAILFLLTLLLRANARMLRRLAHTTNAFRQGHLGSRMEVTGMLESRAVADAFNDMAGKVQSLVLSLHDTQRQQSEQLHFTRQLIDALPLPVFVRDADGTTLDMNRAWQRLFHTPAGPAGASTGTAASVMTATYPEELAPGRSAQIAAAQNNVIRIHRAHQPPLYMAYYEAPFTSTSGALAGTIGTLVDVTERVRAQEALHAEKERAEVALASIGDGVITTNQAGHIDTINEAAQLMTGFTALQALGRPLDDVFRLHKGPASHSAHLAAERNNPPGTLQQATQEVLIHRSGERCAIEYTASPIRRPNGVAVGCVLVFRDVTETRNLRLQMDRQARRDPLTGL
ncbi:PAS domain-containing protein [Acidovorax sp.]|uniref:PAS domain-containing protein n=1 Tax=Acidovorax sp. TaxID=1872122 RepID=UPI002620DA09|nr:PAS domain-containing protein [Acidovorax sp.]